ncbi:hypothetical protein LH991_08905 [Schleiferilactobacillus harbinensis]|nr:hypothetical protein LH991_08905 [Schleiferilactobacillus harbinensis]
MKTSIWLTRKSRPRTKATRISPPERVFHLKNQREDFLLMKKQAVIYFHWSIQDFDDADYYEMCNMMAARDEKDRPVDPGKMWKQYQEKG